MKLHCVKPCRKAEGDFISRNTVGDEEMERFLGWWLLSESSSRLYHPAFLGFLTLQIYLCFGAMCPDRLQCEKKVTFHSHGLKFK